MNAKKDLLLECIRLHLNTAWDACEAIWEFILSQSLEEQKSYFSVFLSEIYIENLNISDDDRFLSDDVRDRITEDIYSLANRIVANLVRQRLPEDSFYENLWEKISDETLLPDKQAQISFLMRLWLDPRIPYYQVGEGCTMDDDEFSRIRDAVWPAIKKALFILAIPFSQKTQRMSLIMELADGLKDDKEKAVFWAGIMSRLTESSRSSEKSDS